MDKQTLFEHARKNLYCSRCNGLLLEVFLQIVMYGKSSQQKESAYLSYSRGATQAQSDGLSKTPNGYQDETQDPSVHPWGGLITTRDGTLTLLDCYIYSKPLEGLQNVFDSAHARERERILLYPHACGTGERGWITPGNARGHVTRETCPLHTARLSCDTLVDFWSALGEETRQSLLRMKEEDFIERLMYRFDSKRFCRDCRRNVIREFKELKELKRMRRETRCTGSFCVADTAFQYEMTETTIQLDWRQTFADTGKFHYFEWAVGSAEGKCDILDFENVGTNGRVQVNGLDLGAFSSCYITLRAWKLDGRCIEHCVKAHALKDQQCVHSRLLVGDGFVTINKGESIRRFFEHAEEAEEEEDDDIMDKDGNELDGECSRPQKHAKSPKLAREFLLDAATVIFKEQVEKAFREGTARQNAHSMFVCLALKLLEERIHVAFKEIITLEKQTKLLEEEEKEKQEEEERKEKRRAKEREKKLRRKERLKGKDKDKSSSDSNEIPDPHNLSKEETSTSVDEESNNSTIVSGDPVCETDDNPLFSSTHVCDDDEHLSDGYANSEMQNHTFDDGCDDGDFAIVKDENSSFSNDHLKYSRRRMKYRKEFHTDPVMRWADRRQQYVVVSESAPMSSKSEPILHNDHFDAPSRNGHNGLHRQKRITGIRSNNRSCGTKFIERPLSTSSNRHNTRSFSSNQNSDSYSPNDTNGSVVRTVREAKFVSRSELASEASRQYHRGTKFNQVDYMHDNTCGRPKSKTTAGNNNSSTRDSLYVKKVWEPLEPQKYHKSNSDSDLALSSSSISKVKNKTNGDIIVSSETDCCGEIIENSGETIHEASKGTKCSDGFLSTGRVPVNTDNCSSCPSEGDSNTTSITSPHHSSSTSESEDATQKSEEPEVSICANDSAECHNLVLETGQLTNGGEPFYPSNRPAQHLDNGKIQMDSYQHQGAQNQNLHYSPIFQATPTMSYHHQNPWPQASANNLMVFPHHPHYVFTSPLSYGFNGNSPYYVPYNSMHDIATPLINQTQVPMHHRPVSKANGVINDSIKVKVVPGAQRPIAAPVSTNDVKTGLPAKSNMENTGFSLFHFGGPLSDLSSNISDARKEGDHTCYKKDTTIEEYNLFSASNGLQFSLFQV